MGAPEKLCLTNFHSKGSHLMVPGHSRTGLKTCVIVGLCFLLAEVKGFAQEPPSPNPTILTQETHEGDLVLSGAQVMVVANTHLTVNGNIYLSGGAELIARQSIIEVNHYPRQEIFASDSSLLQADTTVFQGFIHSSFSGASRLDFTNCFLINLLSFADSASAEIRDSWIFQDRFGLVQAEGQSTVHVHNCVVGAIALFISTTTPMTINNLRPGYFDHWSARENISPNLTYNVTLDQTEVKDNPGYSGGFEMGWNIFTDSESSLSITNSVLNKIVINFQDTDVHFSNLKLQTPVNFVYKGVHLTNTTIKGQWGIFVTNGVTTVDSCEGVWLWPMGAKETYVANTSMSEFDPREYTGTMVMDNASMTDGFEVYDASVLKMQGSVRMNGISPLFTDDSRVTRDYDVILADQVTRAPLANVDLSLVSGTSTVWQGKTDDSGHVSLEISFDVNTYEQNWYLNTADTTIRLHKAIGIYTSAPVHIDLERTPDGAHWWPAVYVDKAYSGASVGTNDQPFTTIQEGINSAAGGGIVHVAQGEYAEDLSMSSDVFLRGAGAGRSAIIGNVFAFGVANAQISGFTIRDTNTAGVHCYSSSLTISNNAVIDQPDDGIYSSHSNLTIVNNVFANNGHNGIWLTDTSVAIVKNNIIVTNGQFGIGGTDDASVTIDYNDIWSNSAGSVMPQFSLGVQNTSADPLFQNAVAMDFHLRAGSPCTNAGDPGSAANDPDGSRNDMGAFGGPFGSSVVSVQTQHEGEVPTRMALLQNYPNPFNGQTTIVFDLPSPEWVTLIVYNLLGQRVRVLVNENRSGGHHLVSWDGRDEYRRPVGSGVYMYTLKVGASSQTRMALLLR
jgi:parallel beta-helix repeat protein